MAKTSEFVLSERLEVSTAGTAVNGTIDLGAYIDVGDSQGVMVKSVDFIWQIGTDYSGLASQGAAADYSLNAQLVDLNPATAFVRADDQSLIASQHIDVDQSANLSTESQDLFPDNFGPASLSEAFMVVNDTLYLTGGIDGNAAADNLYCTAVITCRVVKLSQQDWMAIAIQSTSSDN